MKNLPLIAEQIREAFDIRTQVRDQALVRSRALTRHCANSIRAIHRSEEDAANEQLAQAAELVALLKQELQPYPSLYYAGYTQDAIKEFVEASCTIALILNQPLPQPDELDVEYATYLNGLAEVTGELRRHCMDILRQGYSDEAERLLACMDDIYDVLVTLDYPDAITNGLRRQTDVVRGIVERTRADLTLSLREQDLKAAMDELRSQLPGGNA
ncbi:MAG TPA: haloacid dehalogenase [Anaerolineaceae bacterium]|nr:haloacid dehalogenase [Anaerolineaceae bacterium]HQN04762.1 haloacid dehalogenase [Anaerolineaceae bacterium]HQP08072.1 haloacid dehalogenase [Anaerolineaceae bacterium]